MFFFWESILFELLILLNFEKFYRLLDKVLLFIRVLKEFLFFIIEGGYFCFWFWSWFWIFVRLLKVDIGVSIFKGIGELIFVFCDCVLFWVFLCGDGKFCGEDKLCGDVKLCGDCNFWGECWLRGEFDMFCDCGRFLCEFCNFGCSWFWGEGRFWFFGGYCCCMFGLEEF